MKKEGRRFERFRLVAASKANGDPVDGIVEIVVDLELIGRQIARAAKNKNREPWWGPVRVRFHKASAAQAAMLLEGMG